MQQIDFQQVESLIKAKQLNYFNFYNADIPIETCQSMQYYLHFQHDVIDVPQKLNIHFNDIEVFTDNQGIDKIEDANHPVSAIASYDNRTNTLTAYYLLMPQNIEAFGIRNDPSFNYDEFIQQCNALMKQKLDEEGYTQNVYVPNDVVIDIRLFNDEKQLLQAFWTNTHTSDPDILTSWNGDHFDYPYLWNRLVKLFGKQNASWLMSKFGSVDNYNGMISITDYVIADLLYLYKPRDDSSGGGLNYGGKQPQYKLDWIAEVETGMKKVEYQDENATLDDLYLKDPVTFLFYNIIDTLLIVAINNKCKHIELHNDIRRLMKTPFSASMRGSSQLFDHYTYTKLSQDRKFIRYGMNTEMTKEIPIEVTQTYPPCRDQKNAIQKPIKIPARGLTGYNTIISKFPGAFVKDPTPKIIKDGSMSMDLDASRLYPSMILQYNISFDSYKARIVPPTCTTALQMMEQIVGKSTYPEGLAKQLNDRALQYVSNAKVQKKKELASSLYYIMIHLFQTIGQSGIDMFRLYEPTNNYESILLKTGLIPLLDVVNLTHPDNEGFNLTAFDYIMLSDDEFMQKYPFIYVVHNPNEANMYIKKYRGSEAISVIRNHIITMSGALFMKQHEHIGLFAGFLQRMYNMRQDYKRQRAQAEDDFGRGSAEWALAENRQKSIKVVMNTTYGLYGLNTFRYSNHWLAQSITNMGMFTIKKAQYQAETLLEYKYG